MNESSSQRKASIPTYSEVVDVLANGFGLLGAKERTLGFQRSWQGKQARYSPKQSMPWRSDNHGLIGELVIHLTGGEMSVADEIARYLHNTESFLLCLRYRPLFTNKSYRFGLAVFLAQLAFPQIALLLVHMKKNLQKLSPLYYIQDFLPTKDQENFDCSKLTQRLIRSILNEAPELEATDFRTSLNKLSPKSIIKLETIEKQIREIKQQIIGKENEDQLLHKIESIRAIYIAGMAIQRFLKYLSNESPHANPAGFLGCISYYIDEFKKPIIEPSTASFYEAHNMTFDSILNTGEFYPATLNDNNYALSFLMGSYETTLQCKYPRNNQTLRSAYCLLGNDLLDPKKLKHLIERFEQEDDYNIFKICSIHLNAFLHLTKADVDEALKSFKSIIEYSTYQQLGELTVTAAQHAIALELMRPGKWVNGCLDPYIPHIAQNSRQRIDFEIGMPTPFRDFSEIPKISDSTKLIMESVLLFNTTKLPTINNSSRIYCNPLGSLDEQLSKFFRNYDKLIETEKTEPAIYKAVKLTFNNTTKSRSVLRTDSVKPYEAIRDIFYYTNSFFGNDGILIHETLNPAIYRYITFPHKDQLNLLKALDSSAYERDCE